MSAQFIIKGGKPLQGEVDIRGAKNAATKLMVASLLTDEQCVLENMPVSADTDITAELLERVGSSVLWDVGAHRCTIHTKNVTNALVPKLSRRNRIPILALGPLLHRRGEAEVPVEGGCPIGHRPINFHIEAFRKMGAMIERRAHSYYAQANMLHGITMTLPYPSVGATETLLLTGVLARGETIIRNAAVEPEIVNLSEMLRAMGAKIHFNTAERVVRIRGVEKLSGVTVRVVPDRNEIVSFAAAALATDGNILVRGIHDKYLQAFLGQVRAMGGGVELGGDGIRFSGSRPYRAVRVETAPHPGFMTDWQQPFCVLLTQAEGQSIIHETVYEDRFGYTKDLGRMGGKVAIQSECPGDTRCRFYGKGHGHYAHITGPVRLTGAAVTMTDIRAGMAHIIAALAAEGESVISGIEHIDRGYEKIDERLQKLGADIQRIT